MTRKKPEGGGGQGIERLVAKHAAERAVLVAVQGMSAWAIAELEHSVEPTDRPLGEAIRAYLALLETEKAKTP